MLSAKFASSSCQFWKGKSIPLQILHHSLFSWHICVNFKFIHFLFWAKGSHQSPNFENFECSGENLPNSSCHFPNHKSVFIKILHTSSVTWKITPLCLFSWNITHFGQMKPIKVHIFETLKCSGENLLNSSCQSWKGSCKPCTHPHPPTLTYTLPHPHTPSQKKITPTHTHSHPAKKKAHPPTPTNTQPEKGHTHPHSPTPSQKKGYKRPQSPTPRQKKVTLTRTQIKGHTQPKEGHTHPRITDRKNVTCLTHT